MEYWQGVIARVNVFSILLLAAGAAMSFGAQKLAPLVSKDSQKLVLPMKIAGLLLAAVGALITLL